MMDFDLRMSHLKLILRYYKTNLNVLYSKLNLDAFYYISSFNSSGLVEYSDVISVSLESVSRVS